MDENEADAGFDEDHQTPRRVTLLWLLFASAVGLFAALALTLDKLLILTNQAAGKETVLGCDLSPIVGCGSVISSPQASIFGTLPNPILGIMGWTALALVAVLLLSGVKLKSWHFWGLQAGVTLAVILVTWLQYQSIQELNALCPYCMVTWAVVIPTFWVVTSFNLRREYLFRFIHEWTALYISIHFLVLLAVIWFTFGSTLWA